MSALDSATADEGAPASGPAAEDLPRECERECPLQSYLSRERERQSTGRSSPPPQRLDMSYAEAESASVSTIANVDNDALSSYDRRKEAVDTLPREVHSNSNSPPACAPTQQNASTHHGRTHHSPFPTCQPRSSVLCIARSAAAAVHSAPPPRVNHVHNKTGLRASQ